ncbi:beta-L-arabinofuranosidase domain-containing protein [Deminuibacter soli]|uniref:Glycoside hydrolase family 127 protein n=1 Tax=Deminuibacter soli TaxID=2291815 RepID=A0A3E1NC99_9BACT|nr:beta-L-arabinofuranosidase domain-containing protein [Deminuibacter soli]RFM25635.1 hypothetical protein DXN05_24175 [Deminuibacter soli]
MKYVLPLLALLFVARAGAQVKPAPVYLNNRAPLKTNPYIELPLGAITPQGWLREMLVRQKNGATGHLDEVYSLMGSRNGWLGGDGDQWERGPYWLDGLVPLAYILHDTALIAKAKPWIEWAINSQQPDGYFGPSKDYAYEPGLQRDNSRDWWPKMVMLKVLQQYYNATGDKRVTNLMTNYFRYQLKQLPVTPLDNWSFWARYRGGDNLMMVYWLYNITGDQFLLQLGDLLHKQTFDYTGAFLHTPLLSTFGSIHGVNLAQGIKEPGIYYQQHPEKQYLDALDKGFADLRTFDETANGMYGGDEALHGNSPTQGAELCSIVEMMYSLESLLTITGKTSYADHLEKIAFNALPTHVNDDFTERQYFQQANQVMMTRHTRNFDQNHKGTDICYGILTGYPCCTSNMHQGWPKFTQNLWYATAGKGLAALVYAPSEVDAVVAGNVPVHFTEETGYPFDETIRFTYKARNNTGSVNFPFELRVPAWCTRASVKLNGSLLKEYNGNQVVTINRAWKNGDVLELVLPMHVFKNSWYENSMSVERGPITYALKIGEQEKTVDSRSEAVAFGNSFTEVYPTTPWNYALLRTPDSLLNTTYVIDKITAPGNYPWNLENAPVQLKTKARRIPSWGLYNDMTGPVPYSIIEGLEKGDAEDILLVPYGCTRLRIAQFPVVVK